LSGFFSVPPNIEKLFQSNESERRCDFLLAAASGFGEVGGGENVVSLSCFSGVGVGFDEERVPKIAD
jgi:hypothetical protein